jgi:acyl carrier protein
LNQLISLDKINEVKQWLLSKKKYLSDIPFDLDLIENDVVDSLSFVEYVLLIEEISGREVVVDDTVLDKVRTLDRVQQHYLE